MATAPLTAVSPEFSEEIIHPYRMRFKMLVMKGAFEDGHELLDSRRGNFSGSLVLSAHRQEKIHAARIGHRVLRLLLMFSADLGQPGFHIAQQLPQGHASVLWTSV